MGPKRKRQAAVICLEEEMKFLCEWGTCVTVLPRVDDLINHVNEHLDVYFKVLQSSVLQIETSNATFSEEMREFMCIWHGCGVDIIGTSHDFTRHVLFHVFHVKIKELGRIVMSKSKAAFGVCSQDENTRNLIPELPERLCCGWKDCDMAYNNAEYFYRHVMQHADRYEGSCKMKCLCVWEGCTMKQTSRYRLKEHLRSHTQEKVVACPKCGALFSCRTKFLDHLRKQGHVEGLRYQCSHCSKRFSTERLLRDHMRHHVNNYKCTLCDMTSPTPSGLKSHMKYRHSTERPYPCEMCKQSCKSSTDLRKHIATFHETNVLYTCNIQGCNYSTKTYQCLTSHFCTHDTVAERYACHVCDCMFLRGALLTKHLKIEHKYKWPSGHKRFRYTMHEDGLLRLQTLRYESVQLVENLAEEIDVEGDDEGVYEGVDEGAAEDVEEGENEVDENSANEDVIEDVDEDIDEGSNKGADEDEDVDEGTNNCADGTINDESYNLSMLVNIATQQSVTQQSTDQQSAAQEVADAPVTEDSDALSDAAIVDVVTVGEYDAFDEGVEDNLPRKRLKLQT